MSEPTSRPRAPKPTRFEPPVSRRPAAVLGGHPRAPARAAVVRVVRASRHCTRARPAPTASRPTSSSGEAAGTGTVYAVSVMPKPGNP